MGYQRRVHGDSCPVSTERQQYSSKMKFLALSVILALAVTLSSAVSVEQALHQEWELFKSTHGKSYSESENEFRMRVFLDNRDKVAAHNALFAKGEVTFTLAMNKFGDLLSQICCSVQRLQFSTPQRSCLHETRKLQSPIKCYWRSEGYVTPVKDQKQCGSCWAFSAVGALEGQHFRKSGELVSLSEQNLVDCSSRYGNDGCNGGLMDSAFEYVVANGGIDTEASYPYEARDKTCRFNAANVGATATGFMDVKAGSESDLMAALASVGPVSVAIDASRSSFQLYHSGVYNEKRCSSIRLDHGVL